MKRLIVDKQRMKRDRQMRTVFFCDEQIEKAGYS